MQFRREMIPFAAYLIPADIILLLEQIDADIQ